MLRIVVNLFFLLVPFVSASLHRKHQDHINKDHFDIIQPPLDEDVLSRHHSERYEPDWNSLDKRPLPAWYDEAKFGIFIHWGVFSVPSFGEWFWYNWKEEDPEDPELEIKSFMEKNYPPGFTYADFAAQFRAEFFDPDRWVDVLQSSGAKYVVLTSKHHEGFTLWPSKYSVNWNAMDVGPKRDLVGDLAQAIRNRTDMHFGLYHSLYEWFNPLYLEDKANNFSTQDFVRLKTLPELYELVEKYRPEIIWSDGDWEAKTDYWNATQFLAWLYNDSPVRDVVVVNDRWGNDSWCRHGDFVNCEDRFHPGQLQARKWENAMTIDKRAWAFRRDADLADFLTTRELIEALVTTVSCGGNLLCNIGPTADGVIRPIFEERLRGIGSWLQVNGEAIFGTRPWTVQNETDYLWFTSTEEAVYGISLRWPDDNILLVDSPVPVVAGQTVLTLLGYGEPLRWSYHPVKSVIVVLFPGMDKVAGEFAWTIKFPLGRPVDLQSL